MNIYNNVGLLKKFNRYLLLGFSMLLLFYVGQGVNVADLKVTPVYATYCTDHPGTTYFVSDGVCRVCNAGGDSAVVDNHFCGLSSPNALPGAVTNPNPSGTGGTPPAPVNPNSTNLPNGAACTTDNQCSSGNCCAGPTCSPRNVCAGPGAGAVQGAATTTVNCPNGQQVQTNGTSVVVCQGQSQSQTATATGGTATATGGSASNSNTSTSTSAGGSSANTNSNAATGGSASGGSVSNSGNSAAASGGGTGGSSSTPSTVQIVLATGPTPTPTPTVVASAQQPNVVAVAGVSASKLPATGLPEAALGLMSFIPLGYKFRKFGSLRETSQGESRSLSADAPHLIWQQRQFNK